MHKAKIRKKKILYQYILIFIFFGIFSFTWDSHAWTITAGFESGTAGQTADYQNSHLLDAWTSVDDATTHTLIDTKANGGFAHTDNQSCRMNWTQGHTGYSECTGIINFPSPVLENGEVWARAYMYFPSNWIWSPLNGRVKCIRIQSNLGKIGMVLEPWPSGANTAQIIATSDDNGVEESSYPHVTIGTGNWYCLEVYVRPSSSSNGLIRVWVDGTLVSTQYHGSTLEGANQANPGSVLTFAMFMSEWNGGAPANQSQWIDDVVVTNETQTACKKDAAGNSMIGPTDWPNSPACVGDNTPPNAPTGLSVS